MNWIEIFYIVTWDKIGSRNILLLEEKNNKKEIDGK